MNALAERIRAARHAVAHDELLPDLRGIATALADAIASGMPPADAAELRDALDDLVCAVQARMGRTQAQLDELKHGRRANRGYGRALRTRRTSQRVARRA